MVFASQGDLHTLSLDGERTVSALVETEFAENRPRLSPDGRWIAYQTDESPRVGVAIIFAGEERVESSQGRNSRSDVGLGVSVTAGSGVASVGPVGILGDAKTIGVRVSNVDIAGRGSSRSPLEASSGRGGSSSGRGRS